ncbi:hypothetical protein T492DRAFT_457178 [Pavlovales sp. CCMP2436]|nr:hypothetical protein T492DRAFT_457178 [Pavlovales sp. CCMP2436]
MTLLIISSSDSKPSYSTPPSPPHPHTQAPLWTRGRIARVHCSHSGSMHPSPNHPCANQSGPRCPWLLWPGTRASTRSSRAAPMERCSAFTSPPCLSGACSTAPPARSSDARWRWGMCQQCKLSTSARRTHCRFSKRYSFFFMLNCIYLLIYIFIVIGYGLCIETPHALPLFKYHIHVRYSYLYMYYIYIHIHICSGLTRSHVIFLYIFGSDAFSHDVIHQIVIIYYYISLQS